MATSDQRKKRKCEELAAALSGSKKLSALGFVINQIKRTRQRPSQVSKHKMTPLLYHIQVSKSIQWIHQHQTLASLRFRIQETNCINKLNLDRSFQRTFPILKNTSQLSLNYIYTHGDILDWLNQSNVDFKVLSLHNFHGWSILFSKMLQTAFAVVRGLLGQRKLPFAAPTGFLTGRVQQVKQR